MKFLPGSVTKRLLKLIKCLIQFILCDEIASVMTHLETLKKETKAFWSWWSTDIKVPSFLYLLWVQSSWFNFSFPLLLTNNLNIKLKPRTKLNHNIWNSMVSNISKCRCWLLSQPQGFFFLPQKATCFHLNSVLDCKTVGFFLKISKRNR